MVEKPPNALLTLVNQLRDQQNENARPFLLVSYFVLRHFRIYLNAER
jgi:hypothetical protein